MPPASQQSIATPSYAATPTGTTAGAEGGAQTTYAPTGMNLNPEINQSVITPTWMESNEEVDPLNAVPRPGMPAGSGGGTQLPEGADPQNGVARPGMPAGSGGGTQVTIQHGSGGRLRRVRRLPPGGGLGAHTFNEGYLSEHTPMAKQERETNK